MSHTPVEPRAVARRPSGGAGIPLALVLGALLAACAEKPPVKVLRDPLANFAAYRTYAWVAPLPEPSPGDPDPTRGVLAWRVRTAVDAQMAANGYAPAGDAPPDLLVGVRSAVDEKEADSLGDFVRYREAGGSEPFTKWFSFGGYEEVTLTVELFDAGSRHMIWRGAGVVALDAPDRGERAAAAVAEMFTRQPPR
jgi:hypothetical protein